MVMRVSYRYRKAAMGLVMVAVFAAYGVCPSWSHSVLRPARLLITVQARIRAYAIPGFPTISMMAPREVTFSPDLVNVGTVIISVSNSDNEDHVFQIDGVATKLLSPGGRTNLRVTFRRPGVYPISVSSSNPVTIGGTLKVIK
jgi:hypothetical protein